MVITVLTAVLGIVWISWTRVDPDAINPSGRPPSPYIGHPAPAFTLDSPEGETLTLSELKGRPVILNFWATWCAPCRAEIPALEAASQKIGERGVILGVNVGEDPAQVARFAAELGMTYSIVLDPEAEVSRLYRVRALPTTYFIDARGVITDIYTGPLNEPLLQTRIDQLSAPDR
jgi:thiol-disulfide isomerase/thioredoxin